MSTGVHPDQRHRFGKHCPVCDGRENDPRGAGRRCHGYTSEDGTYVYCSRDDNAGALQPNDDGLFRHYMHGACRCGTQHGPPLNGQGERRANGEASIVATYDYVDESGRLLFQVVRKTGKRFLQRMPTEDGGWNWKTRGVRRVLYRLPELARAQPDEQVYIVEGEKDVDTLWTAGLVATCNPGGAKKWRYVAELSQDVLKGRDVRIVADRDDDGRLHAEQVSAALAGHARSVRVIELPSHKDVSEFFEAGGTPQKLSELFEAVSLRSPAPALQAVPSLAPVADLNERLWVRSVVINNDGSPAKFAPNLALYLTHHEAWRGCFRYNEFADRLVWGKTGPKVDGFESPQSGEEFADHQAGYIAAWYAKNVGPRFEKTAIYDAMTSAARAHAFNPWRDFLLECEAKWDGRPRLDTWLLTYLGAPALPVNLRIGPMWLIGAVARGLNPGCKMDYVLVLESDQGARKNTALETLFGDEFYLPDLPNLRDKDAMAALSGVACACIDELSAMRAVDEEAKKSFLSRRIDRFRPSYGRHFVTRPRSCVFAATTNVDQYLTDPTGNRRIWPTLCGVTRAIDVEELGTDRPQLFGEAATRYRAGEHWWPDASESLALREAQSQRDQRDEWDPKIEKYIALREWATVGDCLSELGLEPKDWRPAEQHRVIRSLRRAGWHPVNPGHPPPGRPRRHWVPA